MPINILPDLLLTTWDPLSTKETTSIMNSVHSGALTDPCPHHIFKLGSKLIGTEVTKVMNTSITTASF